jgi:hypothetical protein
MAMMMDKMEKMDEMKMEKKEEMKKN